MRREAWTSSESSGDSEQTGFNSIPLVWTWARVEARDRSERLQQARQERAVAWRWGKRPDTGILGSSLEALGEGEEARKTPKCWVRALKRIQWSLSEAGPTRRGHVEDPTKGSY